MNMNKVVALVGGVLAVSVILMGAIMLAWVVFGPPPSTPVRTVAQPTETATATATVTPVHTPTPTPAPVKTQPPTTPPKATGGITGGGGAQSPVVVPTSGTPGLGSSLGAFAYTFGQPSDSNGTYVWKDGKYTVLTGQSSPVTNVVVQGFTDALGQYGVCESFLPPNSVFQKQAGNDYFFGSGRGNVELTVTKDACVLQFV